MTLESKYPLAAKRYNEMVRFNKIRSEESLRNTLTGLDDPQDPFNPSIGVVTNLYQVTQKNLTGKISLLDSLSMVQVFRNYKEDGVTAEYLCINAPTAWARKKFSDASIDDSLADYAYNRLTTDSLDQAISWYFWIVGANLARWQKALEGAVGARTKADILKDILATVKDRTMSWIGFWGSTINGPDYSLVIKLADGLYAHQLQTGALDPNAPWQIGGASDIAQGLAGLSQGPRCASEMLAEIGATNFASPSTYAYDVRGLTSKNASIIYVSNVPAIRAYKVDGGTWQFDANGGEDIVAALT